MARKAKELSALEVARLAKPGLHAVGGVAGLALLISPSGGKSWILRARIGSRRRDMGLGGYPDVPLKDARESARRAREKIRIGIDPIEEHHAAKRALIATRNNTVNFEKATYAFLEAKSDEWKNPKHRAQWQNTLEAYAFPFIGDMPVHEIQQAHVLQVLEPIWRTKTETASRVRGRIETILDWARVRGYRTGDNPAAWKGHLDMILPKPSKITKVSHFAAMDYRQISRFMAELRKQESMGARALEFAILTAARSGEVRGATWNEFDLEQRVWTIPAERMKASKEHRVPLSQAAVDLLDALHRFARPHYVFPGAKGGQLSDMALTAVLRRMGQAVTAHGFRSTFRDWAAECTNFPNHVVEMALAHTIENKVEEAYRRGDLFEKRKKLMQAWTDYCNTPVRQADVVLFSAIAPEKHSS
jgi:integrase